MMTTNKTEQALQLDSLEDRGFRIWQGRGGWYWVRKGAPWVLLQDPVQGPFATRQAAADNAEARCALTEA